MKQRGRIFASLLILSTVAASADPVADLANEVRAKGWVAYSARSASGDWDLFLCRPDGSSVRALTTTPTLNEFSPLFSRDGQRLLYRRIPRAETLDNNHHGTQGELVVAEADGTHPRVLGKEGEYPWASWSPDGRQIASLTIKGINIIDLATKQVVRQVARQGFFQQLTWSPDGKGLIGVANSLGASWSIGRLELATGELSAVNRVDCCTPDWFPDSRQVVFSWRPRGQQANKGYGWTQLWMADANGTTRSLLYAEDGRHVYGGHVSPDGAYVLFTGNVEEDGDPGHAGAPMGLMRVKDAPLIRGASPEPRAQHPQAKDGPVLTLPAGWEPCWTAAEVDRHDASAPSSPRAGRDDAAARLAEELHPAGWLVFSAQTAAGDWDLFVMRPDGTERRAITGTREFNEAGARFSPDGRRLLYYRLPKSDAVDNNTYGTFDLVIAAADGSQAMVYGRDFPWAAWGPDGTQFACLTPRAIRIVDATTRRTVREVPRHGIVQQLAWSPDGRWFTGTANGLGAYWNIAGVDAATGDGKALSETDRYNCTPDWLSDSSGVVYARGIIPEKGGRAELWWAPTQAGKPTLLYAEGDRHVYGACASPDGRYLLFTRSVEDLGNVDNSRTTMAIIRRADAPMIDDESAALSQANPSATRGPRLDLGPGWEPHWGQPAFGATGTAATAQTNPRLIP